MRSSFAGVDPGLVHTGLVVVDIYPSVRTLDVQHHVIEGEHNHAEHVATILRNLGVEQAHTWVESYRERGNVYSTDSKMRQLLADFRKHMPKANVLDNTGVKKVVRRPLMQVMGMDQFPTTHHQDLESAARIMLYGMLKDEKLNALVTNIVVDNLDGQTWRIER